MRSENRRWKVEVQRPSNPKIFFVVWFHSVKSLSVVCLFDQESLCEHVSAAKASQLMKVIRLANQRRPAQTPSCAL